MNRLDTRENISQLRCIIAKYNLSGMEYEAMENVIQTLIRAVELEQTLVDNFKHIDKLTEVVMGHKDEFYELKSELEQVKAERDRAVEDLEVMALAMRESEELAEGCCFACEYDAQNLPDGVILAYGECPGYETDKCFEWRGYSKEANCGRRLEKRSLDMDKVNCKQAVYTSMKESLKDVVPIDWGKEGQE